MELRITRGQPRSTMGEMSFQVEWKLDLTQEEIDLANRFEATLGQATFLLYGSEGRDVPLNEIINMLARGWAWERNNIDDLLHREANVKEACKKIRAYIEALRGFDGQETIESI